MANTPRRGKAWKRHTPGRKETMNIAPKNRVPQYAPGELVAGANWGSAPLKRKYLVYRAYMQAPVGAPAQPKRVNNRPGFPMSRNRAIPSSLAPLERR